MESISQQKTWLKDMDYDRAESKEEFQIFFEKKYSLKFPDLNDCIYQKKKELSDFDKKLWIAMHYNPRKDEGG